jgi:hypothetical protein
MGFCGRFSQKKGPAYRQDFHNFNRLLFPLLHVPFMLFMLRLTGTAPGTGRAFLTAKGPVQGIKSIACSKEDDKGGEDVLHGGDRGLGCRSLAF